jgi:hypothetical protein
VNNDKSVEQGALYITKEKEAVSSEQRGESQTKNSFEKKMQDLGEDMNEFDPFQAFLDNDT